MAEKDTSKRAEILQAHPLAAIYQYWTIDCIIEVVRALAFDVLDRPGSYRGIEHTTADTLLEFRNPMGQGTRFSNLNERFWTYRATGTERFCKAIHAMRATATSAVERIPSANTEVARHAHDQSVGAFRTLVHTIEGNALIQARENLTAVFDTAIRVLKSPDIAQSFGVSQPPGGEWPFEPDPSDEGGELVEAITGRLLPVQTGTIHAEKFAILQRVGYFGACTIAEACGKETFDAAAFERHAYAWERSLRDLVPNVIRAWRDPDYFSTLSDAEKALLPLNPIGEVRLPAAGESTLAATQTFTVGGDVCCCDSVIICVQTFGHCYTMFTTWGFCCRI